MKWSELDRRPPPAPPETQWVEDRLLDFFADRLDSDCPLVTDDSRLGEDLNLRGRRAEELFGYLDREFGFRATESERREILSGGSTVGDVIRLMRAFVERRPGSAAVAGRGGSASSSASGRADAARREPTRESAREAARAAAPSEPDPPIRFLQVIERAEPRREEPRKPDAKKPAEPRREEAKKEDAKKAEPRREDSRREDSRREDSRRDAQANGSTVVAPAVPRPRTVALDGIAFTQKRGEPLSQQQWRAGPLYEPTGKTREGWPQFLRATDGMRCVLIPAAEVVLGSDADAAAHPERGPTHTVRVSRFLMDAEPVSAVAYARFLNSVGSLPESVLLEWLGASDRDAANVFHPLRRSWLGHWSAEPGTEMQPMTLVSWYGANAYSLWAHRWDWRYYNGSGCIPEELTSYRFEAGEPLAPSERELFSCLPTEAQWEYAARGSQPRRWPWGEAEPTLDRVCVLRLGPPPERFGESEPALPADAMVNIRLGLSPFGLHHMAGHVRQWCRDYYDPRFYATSAARRADPANRESSDTRSERGGSGTSTLAAASGSAPNNPLDHLPPSSHRRGRLPHSRGRLLGFRCVGSPDEL